VRQGERLDVTLSNRLPQPTTIHWHGIRVPNDMDGVPNLTQDAVVPGELFHYSFRCADAGTYWYHPHGNSSEQLGRGLWGALIVEEAEPPRVDRDLIWLLSDWKLIGDGTIDPVFGTAHERSHNGRLGNVVTVNGAPGGEVALRRNERVRLRLLNVANARIFDIRGGALDPWLMALDGQPVPPRRLGQDQILLAPGMRADLFLDAVGDPGARIPLPHVPPGDDPVPLMYFRVEAGDPIRPRALEPPTTLPANPIARPELSRAERHEIVFAGGAMPGMRMPGMPGAPGQDAPHPHAVWTLNGVSMPDHGTAHDDRRAPPLLTFKRGSSIVLALVNDTVFDHPIHLHGHTFRVISRNGEKVAGQPWSDTVLLQSGDKAEIAFVADNPGDWMLHCHILEHQASGMGGIVRVTA
jgi:FtsP/CotA-like multicopper oxidase with cupredoxin domain